MMYACSKSEQMRIRATELQDELRSLHADHSTLVEQYEVAQRCNAGLQHDLKACKHSLKQVLLLSCDFPAHSRHVCIVVAALTPLRCQLT